MYFYAKFLQEQSDLGLHCFLRAVCLSTKNFHNISHKSVAFIMFIYNQFSAFIEGHEQLDHSLHKCNKNN